MPIALVSSLSARRASSLLAFSFLLVHAQSASGNPKKVQLSNLSDGGFERQLDVPPSEALAPGTPLMQDAVKTYATLPFDIGERMRFVITYLGVKGGVAELMMRTPIKWESGWAHRMTGEVKSAEWYAWIMRIHDSVEGLMAAGVDLAPLRFYINQQEGDFRQTKVVEFSQKDLKVRQKTQRKGRDLKSDEFPLTASTKDALGALYFFRKSVPTGTRVKAFEFPVFTSEKTWTLKATFEKEETLKRDGQKFQTDVWRIQSYFGGLMEQKGDVRLWLIRDERRLPLYVEANVKFGYIKLQLTEWDQGYADPKAKKIQPKLRIAP
jgi:hypothetical protein